MAARDDLVADGELVFATMLDTYGPVVIGTDDDDDGEVDYDLGVCQTCGMYGRAGSTCTHTPACREYGSLYM